MKKNLLFIITAVALLSFPSINYGQAPNLGTAVNFVLFSTNGSVSNTGLSHLTGNVGTNNGSSTAFGNVNGGMHDQDGTSAQCATDLLIAYNQLNAAIPTVFPAPLLGNGTILTAGVYSITGATVLNLNLTLNAQGNPNAVFIFQIQGSLSTNAGSKIKLINGALACNVYWKVEGLVDMATGTTMRGTIIANNAAINMNTGDTLEGRALTTAGAITVDGVLAYTPIGCGSPLLTGPTAPNMGTAGCYAIFSSNGPNTNSGVSYITGGDIGTNVGLTTGYQALNVVGNIHPIPDGSTGICATDLLNAYSYLNALPYDIELMHPNLFGSNLVLTPHTYVMNGATTFNDTLYLDAMGNANAVFILKLYGAIQTSTYSKVLLINGAQAKNVYWMVSGAVAINDYSEFKGTIVCNNGAISLNNGVMLVGKALTTGGAVATAAINVTVTAGCASLAPNITSQPVNNTICAGNSATFAVAASGTGLTYQWRKGVVNLTNGGNISGATSQTLTINPAGVPDVGANYNVVISGTYAPVDTSANVALVANTSPIINIQPINQSVVLGNSASFSVAAAGTGLTYQWRIGNVNLNNGGNISGATSATLTINPTSLSDILPNYNVVITGSCSPASTSTNAALTSSGPAGINSIAYSNESASIYPSPFSNSINVVINNIGQINTAELKIYNVVGYEVMSTIITKQLTTIETNNLPSGIYFYRINGNNITIKSGRLISQQ